MKIPITIDYGIHQSQTTFEPTEYYCPHCGEKKVYAESGPGDYCLVAGRGFGSVIRSHYHAGAIHICVACAHGFYIPDPPRAFGNGTKGDKQTIEQLRKATT